MRFSDIPRGGQARGISALGSGIVALTLIALATYFGFSKQNPFRDRYELNAVFENTNRLGKRSPVRIAGVDVGKVVDIKPLEDGSGLVRVKMEIADDGLPIKRDAHLKVRSRLFLEGNYFVDLNPGRPSSPELPDGSTIPPNQTASPVQFGQVLTTLQTETREDLRTFLKEYSQALKGEGAAGFNQAIKHWEDAYRNTSQVNDATRGYGGHDLSRVLDGQSRVFGALSRDEERLKELVTDLNRTVAAFAAQEDNLRAAIPELRDVFREGRPALASLNRALPEIRGFARDATPGARSSNRTLDFQIPFIRQARRLVSEGELGGLTRRLRVTVPLLVRLNRRSPRTFEQNRALARCQNQVLRPFAEAPIPDPDFPYHTNEPWYKETVRAFVGLSGESRLADPNSPFFRTQAGGGPRTLALQGTSFGNLFGPLTESLSGARPLRPNRYPVFRPDIPCETQDPPNLNAAGGGSGASGPEIMARRPRTAGTPIGRELLKNEPEAYRRMREYSDRLRRGLPALDPLVWGGESERRRLREMGLERDRSGRIVEIEERRR